jgi:glycosyltransferase involved in cell wall biosynthesis
MNVGIYFQNVTPEIGGGYTFEHEILQSLLSIANESHHFFTIYSRENIGKRTESALSNNIHFEKITRSKYIGQLSKIFLKISNFELFRKRSNIELMIYCNPHYVNPAINIPYITMVWDLQHRLQPWFPEVSAKGEWDRRERYFKNILGKASYIITGTKVGQKEISLFYGIPENRIKILPHPTPDFAINNSSVETNNKIPHTFGIRKKYLIYPAQFWPHKNHANILVAIKILKEKYKIPLSIVFLGSDQGNLSYIKKMAVNLQLSDDVHFLGFISRDDLVALYRNAFAMVYMSFFGPENMPPLEAFALKCPVVAAKVSGSDEQLGDAAILVDPKYPEEIAQAILKLYDDEELRIQLIQKGYSRANQWMGKDFIRGLFSLLDDFEHIRKCWDR